MLDSSPIAIVLDLWNGEISEVSASFFRSRVSHVTLDHYPQDN